MDHRPGFLLLAASALFALASPGPARGEGSRRVIEPDAWRVVERHSGPVVYYRVVGGPGGAFLRSDYRPPDATTVMGYELPPGERRRYRLLRWRWRVLSLPRGGNECEKGRGDSAAAVYATWKSGLKYYTLKFVWSAGAPRGAVCDRQSGLFHAQQTVVLQSGGPTGEWTEERVDLDAAYRRHFEGGDGEAEVPELIGLGLMSDGDQTGSESAADFGPFTLESGPPDRR